MKLDNAAEDLVLLQLVFHHLNSQEIANFSMASKMQPSIPFLGDQTINPPHKQTLRKWTESN